MHEGPRSEPSTHVNTKCGTRVPVTPALVGMGITEWGSQKQGLLKLAHCQPGSKLNERAFLKRTEWRVREQGPGNSLLSSARMCTATGVHASARVSVHACAGVGASTHAQV